MLREDAVAAGAVGVVRHASSASRDEGGSSDLRRFYFEKMPDPLRPNSLAALCAALLMI